MVATVFVMPRTNPRLDRSAVPGRWNDVAGSDEPLHLEVPPRPGERGRSTPSGSMFPGVEEQRREFIDEGFGAGDKSRRAVEDLGNSSRHASGLPDHEHTCFDVPTLRHRSLSARKSPI